MSNAQAEQMALLPTDAHDPQDDRPTIETADQFNAEFADALAWEHAKLGTDPVSTPHNF